MREGTSETGVHRAPEVGAPASVRRPVTWTMFDEYVGGAAVAASPRRRRITISDPSELQALLAASEARSAPRAEQEGARNESSVTSLTMTAPSAGRCAASSSTLKLQREDTSSSTSSASTRPSLSVPSPHQLARASTMSQERLDDRAPEEALKAEETVQQQGANANARAAGLGMLIGVFAVGIAMLLVGPETQQLASS